MKIFIILITLFSFYKSFSQQYFIEESSTVANNISIIDHYNNGGFYNKTFQYSGSGLISQTTPTNPFASGGAYVYLQGVNKDFIISNFSTDANTSEMVFSFFTRKSNNNSDNTSLKIDFSYDGINFIDPISIELQSGTSWAPHNYIYYTTGVGLQKIRFINSGVINISIDAINIDNVFGNFKCPTIIYATTDDSPTGSMHLGSLRSCVICSDNASTLNFDDNVSTINILFPITIDKSITIQDNTYNGVQLNMNSGQSNLIINTFGNLTLKNITLFDNKIPITSPIILVDGELKLEGTIIKSNPSQFPLVRNNSIVEIKSNLNPSKLEN